MTNSAINRLCPAIACLAVTLCLLPTLTGCSRAKPRANRDVMSVPTDTVATAPPAVAAPAAVPATPSDSYTSDQLVLASPVQRVVTKQGLVFLHFRYADREGIVRECELPQAMAQNSYSLTGWLSLFRTYSKPQVVVRKPVRQIPSYIYDLPIISPTPRVVVRRTDRYIPPTLDLSATGLLPGEIQLQAQATKSSTGDTGMNYVDSSEGIGQSRQRGSGSVGTKGKASSGPAKKK